MKFWKKTSKNQSKFEEIKGISTIDDLLSHICPLCKTHLYWGSPLGYLFHELTSVALALYDSGPIGVGCVMYSLNFLSKPEGT